MPSLMSSTRDKDSQRFDSRARDARAIDLFHDSLSKGKSNANVADDSTTEETNNTSGNNTSGDANRVDDDSNVDVVQYPSTARHISGANVSRNTTVAVRPAAVVVDKNISKKGLHQQVIVFQHFLQIK